MSKEKIKIVRINDTMDIVNAKNKSKDTYYKSKTQKHIYNTILKSPRKIKELLEKRKLKQSKTIPEKHISQESISKFKSQFNQNKSKNNTPTKHIYKKKYKTRKTSRRKNIYHSKRDIDIMFKDICNNTKIMSSRGRSWKRTNPYYTCHFTIMYHILCLT